VGEFSIGRALRDILSSPIMINNDRILTNIAAAGLMSAVPATLREGTANLLPWMERPT
jgi:acyl-CoA dehydrogenase